jgi:hypothetical protein
MWLGSSRWNRETLRLIERLLDPQSEDRGHAAAQPVVRFELLEQLPPPVAAYLRASLTEGQAPIRSVRLAQAGEFRVGGLEGEWSPFEAMQYSLATRPGFLWDATIRMGLINRVRVRDAYVDGHGLTQAKLMSLLPMADASGRRELDAGALHRYLAEAAWFPTALLPGAGVQWKAIDHRAALASVSDCGLTVSLQFHFNEDNEIARIYTPGRYREVRGRYKLTPWEGRFDHYRSIAGMRVPGHADVAWHLSGESVSYFRCNITETEYNFAA